MHANVGILNAGMSLYFLIPVQAVHQLTSLFLCTTIFPAKVKYNWLSSNNTMARASLRTLATLNQKTFIRCLFALLFPCKADLTDLLVRMLFYIYREGLIVAT